MTRENYLRPIREWILSSETGTLFITSDFLDIADTDSINKSLSRLMEENVIRRILRGVYEYPEYSDFLKEYVAPSPSKIAKALARNYGWTIVPNGDTALNQLGLSTQVPAEWTYVSDGPYKEYSYDKTIIRFKHTANRDISHLSHKTALIIQAIRAIGKENMDQKMINKFSRLLSEEEKTNILTEGQYMTAWVYELIKRICKGGSSS